MVVQLPKEVYQISLVTYISYLLNIPYHLGNISHLSFINYHLSSDKLSI